MLQRVKVRHICEFREITQAKRLIDHCQQCSDVMYEAPHKIADRVDSYWNDWIHQWTFTEQQIISLHLNSVKMKNVFCLLWHKEYCFRVEASTSTSSILFHENTQQPFMNTVDSSHI